MLAKILKILKLNPKFKIQKKFRNNTSGVLVINKLKSKKIYKNFGKMWFKL